MGPAPMEGVERTNAVVVRGLGSRQNMGALLRRDPYVMEIDQGRNLLCMWGIQVHGPPLQEPGTKG